MFTYLRKFTCLLVLLHLLCSCSIPTPQPARIITHFDIDEEKMDEFKPTQDGEVIDFGQFGVPDVDNDPGAAKEKTELREQIDKLTS